MTLRGQIVGMAKATHFGPALLVVTITFLLSITQLSAIKSVQVALAILAGQCVVGWSNDLLDHDRDAAAARLNKPLVGQLVSRKQLQIGVACALSASIVLSFAGPLGLKGGFLHMLGLGSATIYNFWAKATWISPLPYAISFGALPWAVFAAAHKHPPVWLFIDFSLVSLAFHFLNVIKDLEWDRTQLVMGLPQRIGKRGSALVAAALSITGILLFALR